MKCMYFSAMWVIPDPIPVPGWWQLAPSSYITTTLGPQKCGQELLVAQMGGYSPILLLEEELVEY